MKKVISTILVMMLLITVMIAVNPQEVKANNTGVASNLVIVLDPGHGGSDGGATRSYNGRSVVEKNCNLAIALACKAELEQYQGVTVYLTRSSDSTVSLQGRVDCASSVGANVFVALHNNSQPSTGANGAQVYYQNKSFNSTVSTEGYQLSNSIMSQINGLGLPNAGIYARGSECGDTYSDGSKADYYYVLRGCKKLGICGIIVEHAYVSNPSDAVNYLSNPAMLNALGVADATGIANYYGLTKDVDDYNASTGTVGVKYATHVQDIGWMSYVSDGAVAGTTGRSKRLEAIKIYTTGIPNLGVSYKTHVQNEGWVSESSDNRINGTTGKGLRLEAIEIALTGDNAQYYDIYYRVHAQDYGWLSWAKNGEPSGTSGLSKRLEGIQIVIVPKGQTVSKTYEGITPSCEEAYVNANGASVETLTDIAVTYQTHVQNVGWQGTVKNGAMAGTSGQSLRLEGIKMNVSHPSISGGIRYQTHVQNVGWQDWVSDGQLAGTSGKSLRLEGIRIELTGNLAEAYSVRYRVHVQNIGWQDWVYDGELAGTEGKSLRLEAIEVEIVPKAHALEE